ncbi:MAG: hypothetical protein ACI9KE_003209 [Polyangiales bacterium]|jgi:hypothetical protein
MMSRRFTARSLQLRAFLALASLLVACDEVTAPELEPAPPRSSPETLELPEEVTPSAFSAELTRFEADVAAFEDLESCEQGIGGALPSALSDVLADLRYERLVEDVCTVLAAASEQDAARCDELATRAVQEGCRRRVAALLEDPALCARREDSGDVSCLAWSTGRAELCAAAPSHEQALCDAVARGDARACEDATVPGEATCRALVARHGPRDVRPSPPSLEVEYEGHIALPTGDVALDANVEGGLFLRREECAPQLVIEGRGSPRVQLSFGDPSGAAELRYFDGQTILGIRVDVEIQNQVVEAQLGGRISGLVETEIELDGNSHALSLQFTTYVKNWLGPNECAAHDATQETP